MMHRSRIVGAAWIAAAATAAAATPLGAQAAAGDGNPAGAVYGRIVDPSGAPLPNADIAVEGATVRAFSDLHGRYSVSGLPGGTYALFVRLIGYTAKVVRNVEVRGGSAMLLDVTLSPSVVALEAIEVTAEVERGSAAALIQERRASAVVVDAIGSQQIARSPDSDAAAALKRVTGLSVVDGRYVYVRGLGERYSAAQLNGTPLPSPEPDRRAVPLDLFPSSLLQSVVIAKTYSPDKPGDYAGGLVDIQTKDFPGQRTLQVSLGSSYNSATTLRDGLSYGGGSLDWLGVDDGSRELPGIIPSGTKVIDSELDLPTMERIGEAFEPTWQPRDWRAPVNTSGSFAFADQTTVLGMPTGLLASATYANSYSTQELIERILVVSDEAEEPETDYTGVATRQSVRWSTMAKLDLLPSRSSQLTVRSLLSRTSDDLSRMLTGYNRDRNTDQLNYRLRFTTRSLWSNSLEGEHFLAGLGGSRLTWRAGYSRASTDEPDRREVVYDQTSDGRFAWRELTNSGTRYFTAFDDRDVTGALDLTIPLGYASSIKAGGLVLDKDRDFFTRRFRYRAKGPLGELQYLEPNALFAPEHVAPDLLMVQEDTRRTDNYRGAQHTVAAYLMTDLPLAGGLRLSGGVRLERVQQQVLPYDLFPLGLPPVDSAAIRNTDLLPGVNLTFSPRESMNFHAAASQTVARPEFREQAPFDFVDFVGGFLQVGNPSLTRTLIRNYDLRWEWFPRLGDLLAVSGFYKSFVDPIEAVVFPSSELISTWDNNDGATVVGSELEWRTGLGVVASALADFSFVGNVSLMHSTVQSGDSLRLPGGNTVAIAPRERALQGQSPYMINASLTYFASSTNTVATVLYNRIGRRIDKVGTQLLPDVFEEPRHQMDLVLEQRLGRSMQIKLTASNLLDEPIEFRQLGQVVRRASLGRTVSVGFSWSAGGQPQTSE